MNSDQNHLNLLVYFELIKFHIYTPFLFSEIQLPFSDIQLLCLKVPGIDTTIFLFRLNHLTSAEKHPTEYTK
jgi:hypothetical protein